MIIKLMDQANLEFAANWLGARTSLLEIRKQEEQTQKARKKLDAEKAAQAEKQKIRRGIGRPLTRSTACKAGSEPAASRGEPRSHMRHRAGRGQFWWTCLGCGSRRARLEAAADAPLNEQGASSSSTMASSSNSTTPQTVL